MEIRPRIVLRPIVAKSHFRCYNNSSIMTEILRAAPVEQTPKPDISDNYRESRSLFDLEDLFKKWGVPFNFEEYLRLLSRKFAHTESLMVLDGGCGTGSTLEGIGKLSPAIGKKIITVGIDKAERNIPSEDAEIDTFILGTIQNAHELGFIKPNQFHFILDFCGALFYDSSVNSGCGEIIIPIYSQVLASGGNLLAFAYELVPDADWMKMRGKETAEQQHKRFLELLAENNFRIVMQKSAVVLLEKSNSTSSMH